MHAVGTKRPNAFGLYDVLGNVWQWVNDWYDLDYYQHSPSQDPQGPSRGLQRALRGGTWQDWPGELRVSYRNGNDPTNGIIFGGFRCVGQEKATVPPQAALAELPGKAMAPTPAGIGKPTPAPRPREVRENQKDGLKYVWIPPGTFTMGCSRGDSDRLLTLPS